MGRRTDKRPWNELADPDADDKSDNVGGASEDPESPGLDFCQGYNKATDFPG